MRTRNKRKTRHKTRRRKTGKHMHKNPRISRRRVMRRGGGLDPDATEKAATEARAKDQLKQERLDHLRLEMFKQARRDNYREDLDRFTQASQYNIFQ